VGDIVAAGVGNEATFALLLARFVGSATHPVASMQAAMNSSAPKYFRILVLSYLFSESGLFGNVRAARPIPFASLGFCLRLCVKHHPWKLISLKGEGIEDILDEHGNAPPTA
jgi:hypothetical protein